MDFATALLFDRVRRSPHHGPFIEGVEALMAQEGTPPAGQATVVIVPGAFYQQFPASGADGRVVRLEAERLGWRVETVPLPNFSSLEHNAIALCRWLEACDAERIVLVTLSKGGSDVKCALQRPEAASAFARVACWINLSGLLDGTPLAGWLFASSWRSRLTRWLLRWQGCDLRVIPELDRGARLAEPLRLPSHLEAFHVVGFPLRQHATNRLARTNFSRLEAYGPNDGAGILLADACHWPGLLYPLWGADHYLRPRGGDVGALARALLCSLAPETSRSAP